MREDANIKAIVVMHYIEHGIRESYWYEKMKAAKGDPNKPTPPALPPKWAKFGRGGLGATD